MKIEYEDGYLLALLQSVKTIAVVGASQNPKKDSYKVMKFLIDSGYDVLPVNPNVDNLILGKKCFKNLNEIDKKIEGLQNNPNVMLMSDEIYDQYCFGEKNFTSNQN